MYKCTKCKETKDGSKFSNQLHSKTGKQSYCKLCIALYLKENYHKYRDRELARYKKNSKKIIANINQWHKNRDNGLMFKYLSIVRRCKYKSQDSYRWYGALGITIEWNNYKEFKDDMYVSYMNHIAKYGRRETTIDRLDPSKNYSKDNCRWSTRLEQVENRRPRGSVTSCILKPCYNC